MDETQFIQAVSRLDKSQIYHQLVLLHTSLSESTNTDYPQVLSQLNLVVEKYNVQPQKTKKKDKDENYEFVKSQTSSNLFRLLARNYVLVFHQLPTKIYDVANNLLEHLALNIENQLSPIGQLAIIVLIDLYETFPNSLGSLVSFSVNQIYKIMKKTGDFTANLVYLLSVLVKNATKNDIDEKLQQKLMKIATKGISGLPVEFTGDNDSSSISLKKNYILVLRSLAVLSVNSNYENLLATSASATSGAKMKPESIMAHQHQFQLNLLTSIEKPLFYALSNFCKDIRLAAVDSLAHLFVSFIPTGKFDPFKYLADLYRLPGPNIWNSLLTKPVSQDELIVPRKDMSVYEFDEIISSNTDALCYNTGVIETIILYLQLEQFQNTDFLLANMTSIVNMILEKFSGIQDSNHIQNSIWVKSLNHWQKVLEYLVKESGPNCYEILVSCLLEKFNTTSRIEVDQSSVSSKDKRSSNLFSLKPAKTTYKIGDINVFHNSYQCGLVLYAIEQLIPFGVDFNAFIGGEQAPLESENEVDESQKIESSQESLLVDLLFKLIINRDSYIRNYAINTLLEYAKLNQIEANRLVLTCFKLYNSEWLNFSEGNQSEVQASLETNTSTLIQVRVVSYALVLLALLKQTESIHLQNSTIVKVLSFCTQTLKHNSTYSKANHLKSLVCWIILSSLITLYNESEYVKLNSSQFLVFWKSLLTAQYVANNLSGSEAGEEREILDNLKLRNISLICLLNYIDTVDVTPESLKQIQFLLTKAYAYLTYLENNIPQVGGFTSFEPAAFNQESFNVNGAGNVIFSSFGFNDQLLIRNSLLTSILYGKKVIFRNLSKLAVYLKNDINSSMIVLLVKIFSDSNIFSVENREKIKQAKTKGIYNKINDFDPSALVLSDDTNYNYGVTSKFSDFSPTLDELLTNYRLRGEVKQGGLAYNDPFDIQDTYKGQIEQSSSKEMEGLCRPWFDYFEKMIFDPDCHIINNDPVTVICGDYSFNHKTSTSLITSIVDLSIELFQLVFPYLGPKIQQSLLEQIRTSLNSKTVISSRHKAICVNISVAIHGAMNFAASKKTVLDKDIVGAIIEILKKVDINNSNLTELNSSSIGMATSFLPKRHIAEQLDSHVSSIVNDSNPIQRGKSLLVIGKIYSSTGIGSNDLYNVVSQLLNDPNPVVYYYCLRATALLFDNNMSNSSWIPFLIHKIFEGYLDDNFSYDIGNNKLVNLKYKFGSNDVIACILKIFTTNLGPNLRFLPEENRNELRSLIVSLRYAFGAASCEDNVRSFNQLLRLLQELIIFDKEMIIEQVNFYSSTLVSVISKNLKLGLATSSPTSMNLDSIFPFNSSFELFKLGYACFTELIKMYGQKVLTKHVVQLLWVSLNIKPCEELKALVTLWMDFSLEMNWFATLNSLSKISSKKLIQPYIELNYQQKLLPLLQRQKKKNDKTIDFKDEEIENIVGDDGESDDKNEPITWEFKLFIYDLLNNLLLLAQRNHSLAEKLKPRISDLVKVAFLGSTAPINIIKLRGINLLDKILALFGDMEDSMYSGMSILEQQQAQIISAIMPCFSSHSSPEVISNAVNVSSKFINIPRIKFYSKQRIMKTLIYFLEELSSNKFIRFGFLENMSEFGKKSIQVSILNCWAMVRLNVYEDMKNTDRFVTNESTDFDEEDSEPEKELIETLNKYSTLLIALWIVSLREFSTLKYSDPNSKELEIYNNYWVNFVSVLSLELEENHQFVEDHLEGDASTFFFILFSQCVESLIKNKNVVEVLVSLNSLVKNKELADILFYDEIFGEVVDLFDRLILVDEEAEVQIKLVNIVSSLFQTYFESHKELAEGFDKLFELIRLCMLPLFNILPFLRADYDENDKQTILSLKSVDSGPNLVVIKNVMSNLVEMLPNFPDVVRVDLYSCLLFMIAKIYEFKNELLISTVLPYLKQVIVESKNLNPELVGQFNTILKGCYSIKSSNSSILTYMVLSTSGDIQLNEEDSTYLKDSVLNMVNKPDTSSMGVQCIKTMIHNPTKENLLVLRLLVKDVIKDLMQEDKLDKKIGLEVLVLFVKSQKDHGSITKLFSVVIQLIIKSIDKVNQMFLHDKLLTLIHIDAPSFKSVVNEGLNTEQRQLTEQLVKLDVNPADNDEGEIELKTFG